MSDRTIVIKIESEYEGDGVQRAQRDIADLIQEATKSINIKQIERAFKNLNKMMESFESQAKEAATAQKKVADATERATQEAKEALGIAQKRARADER